MTAARKYQEMARCEVCGRIFSAKSLTRGVCPECARKPQTPPPVDFYALDDGDAVRPVDKVCKDCGAHFVASRLTRFCPDCRRRHDQETAARMRERKRAMKGKSGPTERRCARCGKEIDTAHKYCPGCAEARIVERRRAYTEAHRADINARQRANYAARRAAKTGDHNNGQ